tara:strand:+ start:658 stop:918 length:261 start_codon:yes stop_codon:yes gene_type:complete
MSLTRDEKARRAQDILEDEVFIEMIETARQGYVLQWTLSEPGAVEEREALSAANRGLDEMLRGLRTLIADWTVEKSRQKTKRGFKK